MGAPKKEPSETIPPEQVRSEGSRGGRTSSISGYISSWIGWGPEQPSPALDECDTDAAPADMGASDGKAASAGPVRAEDLAQPAAPAAQPQAAGQGAAAGEEKQETAKQEAGRIGRLKNKIYTVSSVAYEAGSSGRAWVSSKWGSSSNKSKSVPAAVDPSPQTKRSQPSDNTSRAQHASGHGKEATVAASADGSGNETWPEREGAVNLAVSASSSSAADVAAEDAVNASSSSASAVAAAALAAVAAYMPSYAQGLEAWQQSWNASKGEYWAYDMGYRISSKAIGAMSSSWSYAGALIPWSSAGYNTSRGEGSCESGTAKVGDRSGVDGENSFSNAARGGGEAIGDVIAADLSALAPPGAARAEATRPMRDRAAGPCDTGNATSDLLADSVAVALGLSSGSLYSYFKGVSASDDEQAAEQAEMASVDRVDGHDDSKKNVPTLRLRRSEEFKELTNEFNNGLKAMHRGYQNQVHGRMSFPCYAGAKICNIAKLEERI